MITESTVFILGAGSSWPYGYPTGLELRHFICNNFPSIVRSYLNQSDEFFSKKIIEKTVYDANEFAEIFFKSSTSSIDLFLESSHNFSEIGRIAILCAIFFAEKNSQFRENSKKNNDWYFYLFQRMTDNLKDPDDYKKFNNNKAAFITFNYDRSLEHFLSESLIHRFYDKLYSQVRLKEKIIEDCFKLKIIHVYGKLASLPWQRNEPGPYIPYGVENVEVRNLTNNIKLIQDRQEALSDEVKEIIKNAKRIFFLGFGYAEENLEILNIRRIIDPHQKIYGTALNYTKKEIEDVKTRLLSAPHLRSAETRSIITIAIESKTCLELLREYL